MVCTGGTQTRPPPALIWEIKSTNTYFVPAGGKALLPNQFSFLVYIKASQAKIQMNLRLENLASINAHEYLTEIAHSLGLERSPLQS